MSATKRGSTSGSYQPHLALSVLRRSMRVSKLKLIVPPLSLMIAYPQRPAPRRDQDENGKVKKLSNLHLSLEVARLLQNLGGALFAAFAARAQHVGQFGDAPLVVV